MTWRARRMLPLGVALCLVAPTTALAQDRQPPPQPTAQEAAAAAAFPIVPLPIFRLQMGYTDVRKGGNDTTLLLRVIAPMPDVLLPGIRIPHMYSLLRIDLPFLSINRPGGVSAWGVSDISVYDAAILPLPNGGIGVGLGMLLPSASDPLLGFGTLQVGPLFAAAFLIKQVLGLAILAENLFSVAGTGRDANVLLLQPVITLNLPGANYLAFDPVWSFDWKRSGHANIPLSLTFGHAFSKNVVLSIDPVWAVAGERQNDFSLRFEMAYIGW
jgi:hypothetical protein